MRGRRLPRPLERLLGRRDDEQSIKREQYADEIEKRYLEFIKAELAPRYAEFIGKEIQKSGVIASVLSLFGILVYVADGLSAEEDAKTGTLRIEDLRRAGTRR